MSIVFKLGKSIKQACKVVSDFNPDLITIEWYGKNNEKIKNSAKYSILTRKLPSYYTFDKESILEIANLTSFDDGSYECRAEVKNFGIKKSLSFDLYHSEHSGKLKFDD